MTGLEFKTIRLALGLTPLQWGRRLGYEGKNRSIQIMIYQLESDPKPVPTGTALPAKPISKTPKKNPARERGQIKKRLNRRNFQMMPDS